MTDGEYIDPPPEARTAERPEKEDAYDRIRALMDDSDDVLYSVVYMGGDDLYWYYLAISEHGHDGVSFLNERYVQLVKPGIPDREDTFKKNGINRRVGDGLVKAAGVLAEVYHAIETNERRLKEGYVEPEDLNRLQYREVDDE